jgi:hypothetical protein
MPGKDKPRPYVHLLFDFVAFGNDFVKTVLEIFNAIDIEGLYLNRRSLSLHCWLFGLRFLK